MATCWVSNSWEKFLVCMSKVWTCKVSFSTNIDNPNLHCKWASSYELGSMIGENWQLVTDELVEFEKWPVEVQDCMKITDHFRGIYRIYPLLIKENWRMSTCNQLDLQTLVSQPIMPRNLSDHCRDVCQIVCITWDLGCSGVVIAGPLGWSVVALYPSCNGLSFSWGSKGAEVENIPIDLGLCN